MSDWYKQFDRSAEDRFLTCETQRENSVDAIWTRIRSFHPSQCSGWFCYTSSLWILKENCQLEDMKWVSGKKEAKGTLLSGELHCSTNGIDETLSIRHDGVAYNIVHFKLGTTNNDGMAVRACYQEFYGALHQEDFPKWKLGYRNCWGKVLRGDVPHQVEVFEPLVGIFVGFNKGEQ